MKNIADLVDVTIWYKENKNGHIITKFIETGHMHNEKPWTLSEVNEIHGMIDPLPNVPWKFINGWIDQEDGQLKYSDKAYSWFDDEKKLNVMDNEKVNLYDKLMEKSKEELQDMLYYSIVKNNPYSPIVQDWQNDLKENNNLLIKHLKE
jgi:hypothetical protein